VSVCSEGSHSGIFFTDGGYSAGSDRRTLRTGRISCDFQRSPAIRAGAALALKVSGHDVFRAALFSIVLTLAVGQNAGLFCKVWCHPPNAAPAGCGHQAPTKSPSVLGDDNCNIVAVVAVAFRLEDARRAGSNPDAQSALIAPQFHLTSSPTDLGSAYESETLLPHRPLVIALRI
jgi:hypothetical protein